MANSASVASAGGTPVDKPVIVFDVVETLLDTAALKTVFDRMFGDRSALRTWLDNLFVYSQAMTITGNYADSGTVGHAVLTMMAKSRGIAIQPADLDAFKKASASMPAYPDVAPGLRRLRDLGYRLVTLSNSPNTASEVQLRGAGIREPFERLFSIDDDVHRYKPARETYLNVARALAVRPSDLWLVSCHAFDVMGAKAAGLHAVFLPRSENAPFGLGPQPDAVLTGLSELPGILAQASS